MLSRSPTVTAMKLSFDELLLDMVEDTMDGDRVTSWTELLELVEKDAGEGGCANRLPSSGKFPRSWLMGENSRFLSTSFMRSLQCLD